MWKLRFLATYLHLVIDSQYGSHRQLIVKYLTNTKNYHFWQDLTISWNIIIICQDKEYTLRINYLFQEVKYAGQMVWWNYVELQDKIKVW